MNDIIDRVSAMKLAFFESSAFGIPNSYSFPCAVGDGARDDGSICVGLVQATYTRTNIVWRSLQNWMTASNFDSLSG